jgi:hypothetical protein
MSKLSGIAFALLLLCASQAHAQVESYVGVLSGASEAPPNASPGTGETTVTVDLTALTLRIDLQFSGLVAANTAAHIHCCTTTPGAGTAGVATQTPTFTGFPGGSTAGTYGRTFDLALSSSYNAAFITANGGTVGTAAAALGAGIDAGRAYLNLHTGTFPGGEIRTFLLRRERFVDGFEALPVVAQVAAPEVVSAQALAQADAAAAGVIGRVPLPPCREPQ